ncbi:MAG: cytochrome d ubiquinol oxidase subunit II [Candidatus Accumulibacter sp.]|jgi:cytochrome d ubiquinol oxidase subunit II|nr:cytochrome d ubiquinol oxidase subunit II [Accumulibacter sp.]
MSDILSHENLQIIWFFLWGLLWSIYFVLDGFDIGLGTLLPLVAADDDERRMVYNAAGPFWDGNEVWLITAGGVTFAAFPKAYAVMFSALYAPLLILLFALIFRAVSFEFRNKIDSRGWRKAWDTCHFFGNFLPALLLGVAFANLFKGIPIDGRGIYLGSILSLLNLYGIAGGVFFVIVFAFHGALWLAIRAEGALHDKARKTASMLWPALLVMTLLFLALTWVYTPLYNNYFKTPALLTVPFLAVTVLLAQPFCLKKGRLVSAFTASAVFIVGVTLFGVFGMFPALVPSSISAAASITVASAASSQVTLTIMLVVALICVPVVIAYQAWVYSLLSFKIIPEYLASEEAY